MEIEKIKSYISSVLDDLNGYLHSDDIIEVKHYLKYNELKISIEMLCEFISESDVEIPKNISEKIRVVSKELNIQDRYWIDLP
jgi:hypothetical protein